MHHVNNFIISSETGYECLWHFDDKQTVTTSYIDQGKVISHRYDSVNNYNITVTCNNTLSKKESSTIAIVQHGVLLETVVVTCNSRYDDCFQHDKVVITVNIVSGTDPVTNCDMGNGVKQSTYFLLSSKFTYRYSGTSFGTIAINVTVSNNVSSQTLTSHLVVKQLREITGMELICPAVKFGEVTSCLLTVLQGTGTKS